MLKEVLIRCLPKLKEKAEEYPASGGSGDERGGNCSDIETRFTDGLSQRYFVSQARPSKRKLGRSAT